MVWREPSSSEEPNCFPLLQERLTKERAVLLQPMGAMWSRSACAAMVEPMVEDKLWQELLLMGSHVGAVLEGWAPWYRTVLEQY